jgi:hypothetical protein
MTCARQSVAVVPIILSPAHIEMWTGLFFPCHSKVNPLFHNPGSLSGAAEAIAFLHDSRGIRVRAGFFEG